MTTLLGAVQAACAELGLTAPSSVTGNYDTTTSQLLALAQREGREQVGRRWPQMRGEHVFTLTPGLDNYPASPLAEYYLADTAWDRSQYRPLAGPIGPEEWQVSRSGLAASSGALRFRFMVGRIYFDPVPGTADTIALEYQSNGYAISAMGDAQPQFLADSDTAAFPGDVLTLGLKWRWLAAKGMNYAEERDAYGRVVTRLMAQSLGLRSIPIDARSSLLSFPPTPTIADGNWGR